MKNGLDDTKTTLCASICSPSSQARVTSVNSPSSLSSLNEVVIFSLKSFHWRQSLSEEFIMKGKMELSENTWFWTPFTIWHPPFPPNDHTQMQTRRYWWMHANLNLLVTSKFFIRIACQTPPSNSSSLKINDPFTCDVWTTLSCLGELMRSWVVYLAAFQVEPVAGWPAFLQCALELRSCRRQSNPTSPQAHFVENKSSPQQHFRIISICGRVTNSD